LISLTAFNQSFNNSIIQSLAIWALPAARARTTQALNTGFSYARIAIVENK